MAVGARQSEVLPASGPLTRPDARPDSLETRKPERKRGPRRRRSTRARQNLALILPLLAVLLLRGITTGFWSQALQSPSLTAAGMLLLLLGLGIRVIARQWKVERSGHGLVTDGVYGLVRHPLYLGSFALWAGLCLLLGDPLLGAVVLLAFTFNHWLVIRQEERGLIEQFGAQFEQYRQSVPGLFPRLFARRPSSSALRLPQRPYEGVMRECDALAAGLAVPLVLLLIQTAQHTTPETRWLPVIPAALLVLLLATWWHLKRDYRRLIHRERAQYAAG